MERSLYARSRRTGTDRSGHDPDPRSSEDALAFRLDRPVTTEYYSTIMALDRTIDEIDLRILDFLQDNARISNAEIARRVGMAPSAVLERVRKLEEHGFVRGYHAQLDPLRLDHGLLAYVFVREDEHPGEKDVGEELAALPEVQEVHHVAGEDCLLVKVRVRDAAALGGLLRERIGALPGVRSTRSTIVLETLKETTRLDLEPVEAGT